MLPQVGAAAAGKSSTRASCGVELRATNASVLVGVETRNTGLGHERCCTSLGTQHMYLTCSSASLAQTLAPAVA